MKERLSVRYIERGQLDVLDGAFVVVDVTRVLGWGQRLKRVFNIDIDSHKRAFLIQENPFEKYKAVAGDTGQASRSAAGSARTDHKAQNRSLGHCIH